jgi:hypothetical protein
VRERPLLIVCAKSTPRLSRQKQPAIDTQIRQISRGINLVVRERHLPQAHLAPGSNDMDALNRILFARHRPVRNVAARVHDLWLWWANKVSLASRFDFDSQPPTPTFGSLRMQGVGGRGTKQNKTYKRNSNRRLRRRLRKAIRGLDQRVRVVERAGATGQVEEPVDAVGLQDEIVG